MRQRNCEHRCVKNSLCEKLLFFPIRFWNHLKMMSSGVMKSEPGAGGNAIGTE